MRVEILGGSPETRAADFRVPIDYQKADVQHLPFPDGIFDVGRAERLFPYLADPEQAFTELVR